MYHRPLKIRTNGGRYWVHELGSVKRGPFATEFCRHSVTDNVNKCCKFVDDLYFLVCVWLNRILVIFQQHFFCSHVLAGSNSCHM